MGLSTDRREWNDLAQRDAMWAISSIPSMRGRWDPKDFFRSGEEEVAGMLAGLEQAGLAPAHRRRALDFGCGLGRLTRALAGRFEQAVGVDLSDHMVEEAKRANTDRSNCEFIANNRPDLRTLPTAHFDLVLSLVALQHVSSKDAIRSYIREFVRVTAPGGVVAFQLPARIGWRVRAHPLRVANRVVRRLPGAPGFLLEALMSHSMSLNALPESEVRRVLVSSGAQVETAFDDNRMGTPAATSLFYVARRPAVVLS